MSITRRRLVAGLVVVPLAVAGSWRPVAAQACYDPAALPASQRGRRRSLGFRDASDNPAKTCGVCAFYTGKGGGCGACQLLGGGAVASGSVCNSWARKP